ncbi:MAG: 2-isopropylmalate synthase [Oligoflexia bacterium]|nr:2-isopropylmalate synthase [Oligoflexia bacterium]
MAQHDGAKALSDAIIYDWNVEGSLPMQPYQAVQVHDETVRDGIQSPSVTDPTIDEKLEMVRMMDALGVGSLDVGLPGAGQRAVEDVRVLVEAIRDEGLKIRPHCAARTHANDIRPVIELSEQTGVRIGVYAFLGTSPVRKLAEDWDDKLLEKRTRAAASMTVQAGLPFCFVTEDTVRSHPQTLQRLFTAAIEEGASRLCLCDTVGHVDPHGVRNLILWTKNLILGLGTDTAIDWHGHNDRGLGLINALVAAQHGATRVHGTVLGVGERVGNTPLDLLMVNLKLAGAFAGDLSGLGALVDLGSRACHVPIPPSYPVFGRDAFRTGTGVHAAAVIKAMRTGHKTLADQVYSGVPASWFGRQQEIEIGHMAGDSNIVYWLTHRNIEPDPELVGRIRSVAKSGNRLLETAEVMAIVDQYRADSRPG